MKVPDRSAIITNFLAVILCLFLTNSTVGAGLSFQLLNDLPTSVRGKPLAGLIEGADHNLYGTTGLPDSVFRMTPDGALTTLYAFTTNGGPPAGKLLQTEDGSLYGTTTNGSPKSGYHGFGPGTLFRLTPSNGLSFPITFNGTNFPLGDLPLGALARTTDGAIFGTTYWGGAGGTEGWGTVFQFKTSGSFSGVLCFPFNGTNGANPASGLFKASDGNFYGTTVSGGVSFVFTNIQARGYGTVFRITSSGEFTSLFSFSGTNGYGPYGGLTQGNDGYLYGTTYYGGTNFSGTLFRISTSGEFTNLVSFTGPYRSGPLSELTKASNGNIYGTTYGGYYAGAGGTVFMLNTNGEFSTVFSFTDSTGKWPLGGLLQASDGNFYGTTSAGGRYGNGTIYRLVEAPNLTVSPATNASLRLTWTSFTNGTYRIEYKTNLAASGWLVLASSVTALGSLTSFTDNPGGDQQRYYRVILLP